jgi:Na+-translocating ferredoxin:NAD+ oxidoreductase RnfC subunit
MKRDVVKIKRKIVQAAPVKRRQIAIVGNKVKAQEHDEEKQNKDFWMTRSVAERLNAVFRLRAQVVKNERMDKSFGVKRSLG